MSPEQCPECGRFLKADLVTGLVDGPAPCPKCGSQLTATMFDQGPPPPPAAAVSASVRPPDLAPDEVRDEPDPLAGWDAGVPPGDLHVEDERPFPVDTVVIVAAGLAGFAVGALVGRRPTRDAALGALSGVVGAAIARRIWRLP